MKRIDHIIQHVDVKETRGNLLREVKGIAIDSREVKQDFLFFALPGTKVDGHTFIDAAITLGATIVLHEKQLEQYNAAVTYIQVSDIRYWSAYIAHKFYNEPSLSLTLVGVTGTNGKTTVATLLFKLFSKLGYKCGLISTVQNQIGDEIIPATHTTPNCIALNSLLKFMVDQNCTHVFMECSSHAIDQDRIAGLHFSGAIFTNITHDHLDYHQTFDAYITAKKKFFDQLPESAFALVNADDKRGAVMLQNSSAQNFAYSLLQPVAFKGKIIDSSLNGLHMLINGKDVYFRLIGHFNAYNLLAVYGAAVCLGENEENTLLALSSLQGAEGRFDYQVSHSGIVTIVDYAHTPDALENVLRTIQQMKKAHERIISVVGCGGDRDVTKRPIMAQLSCEFSDLAILTSDNPRTEDPMAILYDMQSGLNSASKRKSEIIEDRKSAIYRAVELAQSEDIILVAGKGHEKYQEIQGVKYAFDDKLILQEAIQHFKK
ncbi:MAG: UDP-N-acetylmuramoyl-L-alanyl-D-glutamate--2,6-diaminopimelate ligase [Hydrotalea sp.]|nr:UDP-N-acetylmuramoyl-L-alanyl-D-glutamate--2,6-diaminopimelate ligase [Hydrotalea sp.]